MHLGSTASCASKLRNNNPLQVTSISRRIGSIRRDGVFALHRLLIVCCALFVVGCSIEDPLDELEQNHLVASTSIAQIRNTATVSAARAQTTLDFVGTRSAFVATRSGSFVATMVEGGTATEFIGESRATVEQRFFVPSPTPTAFATMPPDMSSDESVPPPPTRSGPPTVPGVTPIALLATATRTPTPRALPTQFSPLNIFNPVMATGVGDDNCARGAQATFSTATPQIYLVASVQNIPIGTTFLSRWFREGTPLDVVYDFTTQEPIDEGCVWFFVDETDFSFTAGTYSVTLEANGLLAFDPIPFTISAGS